MSHVAAGSDERGGGKDEGENGCGIQQGNNRQTNHKYDKNIILMSKALCGFFACNLLSNPIPSGFSSVG